MKMGIRAGGPNVNKFSMDLLKWKEITTKRQEKNGTRIFQLPIKKYGQYIEVGSFESGYVRRMNGCYTPYQLNKCENYDHFYQAYEWRTDNDGEYSHVKLPGKYNKHVCKRRITIDNEVDRIEYLIAYCLKNYYINQANMIENGKFIPKWKYEHELNRGGHYDKVRELQNEVMKYERTVRELHEEMDRISFEKDDEVNVLKHEINKLNNEIVDSRDRGTLDNLTVFVNNEKYKII